jgi:Protein of unknown function, DUF417
MCVQDILRTKGAKLSAISPDASIREAAPSSLPRSRVSDCTIRTKERITTMNTLANATLNPFVGILRRSGLLTQDLDYHLIRASMVIIFLFFGYQKWFEYEAQVLIPYIGNGPLIGWMYPVFGAAPRAGSWASPNGRLVRSCSQASGTSGWAFSAPPVRS